MTALAAPCSGVLVVEVAAGTSDLGLGLAGALPGMMLADLGAEVVRVTGTRTPEIDGHLSWTTAWHRKKRRVATDDPAPIRDLLARADVALVYGDEPSVEGRGLGYRDIVAMNPTIVFARCRPSRTEWGAIADWGLLVEARAGFCSQLAGHRPGPIFVDARAPGFGAALLMCASVLSLLRRRELTGKGGWSETSLYDGLLATLGCMIGRSERAPREVEEYWEKGSTFPNFLYQCADGELLQVWFGGKGMYQVLLELLGDEPSPQGYYADQVTGALNERARRWRDVFATRTRHEWVESLRAAGVACEPVLQPGEILADPHTIEAGVAVDEVLEPDRCRFVATPICIRPGPEPGGRRREPPPSFGRLLEGVRVVDFSAFVAGPLAAQVLADLGADVVKVEPPGGEAMRAAAYAVAACQRGKRSLAIDITAPAARPAIERLLSWADVVLHNFRVGVAERLGIDEATAFRLNPSVVYCHATAFGDRGPRASFPGNDALMQALTGFEAAIGGAGNPPTAATWIPLDMAGGWVSASAILAALFARARTGRGQRVVTSLLGAAMLLHSGAYLHDGQLVPGPGLDADQTGYGPGYRIYRAGDGRWLALVIPDADAWERLRSLLRADNLPERFAPLRVGEHAEVAREAERALEQAFATAPAATWAQRLRDGGLTAEAVVEVDRDGFRRGILDDPVNRQLGRIAAYDTAAWGRFEQIGALLRTGPDAGCGPVLRLPGVGEHSRAVLLELGFSEREIDDLVAAGVVREG